MVEYVSDVYFYSIRSSGGQGVTIAAPYIYWELIFDAKIRCAESVDDAKHSTNAAPTRK